MTVVGRPPTRPPSGKFVVAMLLLSAAAGLSAPAHAADERTLALHDGSRVILRADGSMGHYSASGEPVAMREGEVMVLADGTRLLMKGDALWRQIIDYATSGVALASRFPFVRTDAGERWIDLADGGRVLLRNDGTTIHVGSAGNGVAMGDGEIMIAKDGTVIMMNGGSAWGAIGGRRSTGAKP
jgi:ferric-dicitrate binding protein FerR (iron transport regulator)